MWGVVCFIYISNWYKFYRKSLIEKRIFVVISESLGFGIIIRSVIFYFKFFFGFKSRIFEMF